MVEKKETNPPIPIKERYEISQVPESMRIVVSDNKTETIFTEIEALVLLLNKVDKIERSIA
jgi:hypothetical protein